MYYLTIYYFSICHAGPEKHLAELSSDIRREILHCIQDDSNTLTSHPQTILIPANRLLQT